MATHYLEFEKPIAELDAKIAELSLLAPTSGSFETEIAALRKKADAMRTKAYANLDPWMRTQVARHPQRPHFVDYVDGLFTDFVELVCRERASTDAGRISFDDTDNIFHAAGADIIDAATAERWLDYLLRFSDAVVSEANPRENGS